MAELDDDVQPDSSTGEKPEASATPAAEPLSTDTPDDKGTYVPRTRLNKANEEARAAKAQAEALQSRLEALEAKLSQSDTDSDPEVAGAKKLITDTASPLIERSLAEVKRELAEAKRASQQAAQELQWTKLCSKFGADPDNAELIEVTAGLARNRTPEDALKRAVELLGASAKVKSGASGARVETGGITGETVTSDWVPKTEAEARAGAKKGKLARHLTSTEIIAARKARA